MLIDWFTVAAQLLNFLVLVWLMKRFLYQPVLAAIAARDKQVAATLADAAARLQDAHQLESRLAASSTAFDQQRASLLADATTAARAQSAALIEAGKQAASAQRTQAQSAWDAEQARLAGTLALQARDAVLAALRQAMVTLSDATLEDAIVRAFIAQIGKLDGAARTLLASAAAVAPSSAELRSALPLDPAQQTALKAALAAAGIDAAALRFTSAPALVCGIEFRAGGRSLAWNLDHYLTAFAERSTALLQPRTESVSLEVVK